MRYYGAQAASLAARPMRRSTPRCNHMLSRQPRRVGVSARSPICDTTAEAREAARRSTMLPTATASGGHLVGYRHLRFAARPKRCGTPHCNHMLTHQPHRRVGP